MATELATKLKICFFVSLIGTTITSLAIALAPPQLKLAAAVAGLVFLFGGMFGQSFLLGRIGGKGTEAERNIKVANLGMVLMIIGFVLFLGGTSFALAFWFFVTGYLLNCRYYKVSSGEPSQTAPFCFLEKTEKI